MRGGIFLKTFRWIWLSLSLLLVTGCGVGVSHQTAQSKTPTAPTPRPVHVLTLKQRTQEALTPTLYEALRLNTAKGKIVTVSVKRQPLIFFSPNLGGNALVQNLSSVHVKITPLLVSTGFPPGTTRAQAVKETKALLASTHLRWPVLYDFRNPYGTVVSGLPDTYVWRNGKVWHVPGLLVTSSEWAQALP